MNVVAEEWRAENTGIESGVLETQQLRRACIRPFEIFPFFTSFHPFLRAREKKMAFRSNEEGGRGILSRFRLRLNRFVIGIDTNCDRNYSDRGSNVSVDRKHIFKDIRACIYVYIHIIMCYVFVANDDIVSRSLISFDTAIGSNCSRCCEPLHRKCATIPLFLHQNPPPPPDSRKFRG